MQGGAAALARAWFGDRRAYLLRGPLLDARGTRSGRGYAVVADLDGLVGGYQGELHYIEVRHAGDTSSWGFV